MKFVYIFIGCFCWPVLAADVPNSEKVQIGQSKADVIAAVGKPASQVTDGDFEYWYYNLSALYGSNPYRAVFKNGQVTEWKLDESRMKEKGSGYSPAIDLSGVFHHP
jgi:hypothetical protein